MLSLRISILSVGLLFLASSKVSDAFSAAVSEQLSLNRLILQQAFSSPSGKLTFTPEIVIPEPTDPTALLLQSTEVTKLSEVIRSKAKANAAIVSSSVNALSTLCQEQEIARGNFPGPLPLIAVSDGSECSTEVLENIAGAGAVGILLPVLQGEQVSSCDDIAKDEILTSNVKAALDVGLHPIPEVCIACDGEDNKWDEDDVTALVEAVQAQFGEAGECAGVVLSVETEAIESDDNGDDEEDADPVIPLPTVPKALTKKVPILGSVRAVAGGGRMGQMTRALKSAGFTGAFLRKECVPGLTSTITDLEAVSAFWAAAISDLKSVKSKSFGFRANMAGIDESMKLPMEWYKYQKSVMESGALGDPGGGAVPDDLDTDAGDYRGF